jgi:hypothetical protein
MQIAYSTHDLKEILGLFATGFKVAPGDKLIKSESFVDPMQGKVFFIHTIERAGESEPAPLIVLPNAAP